MAEKIGGIWVKSANLTKAWGVEPASATITGVVGIGESYSVGVGASLAFSIGGTVFYGIVSSVASADQMESGRDIVVELVDQRIRLAWGLVFGQWNMPEEPDVIYSAPYALPPGDAIDQLSGSRAGFDQGVDFTGGLDGIGPDVTLSAGDNIDPPVPPSTLNTAGITRGRLYSSISPAQWASQFKVYTRTAASAASILAEAFAGAIGGGTFALNFHYSQRQPVFNVDANSGMTLAALVSMMCEAQGLQVTLDGSRTLRFSRRGGGVVIPPYPAHTLRNGLSLSSDPTRVRVVGDRSLVQINSINMEPDWRTSWEKFIAEGAWHAEVARVTTPVEDSVGGMAEIAARARELTVGQYITLAGLNASDTGDTGYADYGRWGKISRMDMPAWEYINSVVYRSYRIPDTTMLCGMPMRSMEIYEHLLCAVELSGMGEETAIRYKQDPVVLYPPASAYVIAKGQPLDLYDAAQRDIVTSLRLKNLTEEWIEMPNFTLDVENHSIHFATPIFLDGSADDGKSILAYPNKGQMGFADLSQEVEATSDYLRICVPNANYEISHAAVRCSFVFKLGKFYKDYGTGYRWTVASASSIAEHLLDPSGGQVTHKLVTNYKGDIHMPTNGGNLQEILYDNRNSAEDEADEQAKGIIVRGEVEQSGSYCRYGQSGTTLMGTLSRVSVSFGYEDGLVETVELEKPSSTRGFVSSREIGVRIRSEELFDGQSELYREVRNLRAISRLERQSAITAARSSSHQVMADVFRQPMGAAGAAIALLPDPFNQWPADRIDALSSPITGWRAGDLLWLDGQGLPSKTGRAFGGVVVANAMRKLEDATVAAVNYVSVATAGIVPTACAPGLTSAAALMANPGDWKCTPDGTFPVGMLNHHDPVPGTGEATLAFARLGGGGGGSATGPCNFGEIYRYSEGSGSSSADLKTGIRGGNVKVGAKTWDMNDEPFEIDLTVDCEYPVWLRILVTVNINSTGIATLSGIATSEKPTWQHGTSSSDDYEDTVTPAPFPTGGGASGVLIVPIGHLTVAAGIATLARAGCGDITGTYCPGNLDHYRGHVADVSSS